VAYPDLREHGTGPASTGTSLEKLWQLLNNENQITDLSLVPEGWEINSEDHEARKHHIREKRVRKALGSWAERR